MSHPKGGEEAFNYVVTALSKVLAVTMYGKHYYGMGGPTYDITRLYGHGMPNYFRRCRT